MLELTRYIHLNPLRGSMLKDMSALSRYPWTGHSMLTGKVKRVWQDTDTVLSYFGTGRKGAILHYESFVRDGMSYGRRPDLVGGGLIRSLGGWSQVLSLRRKGVRAPSDDRVLGSGEFAESVLSEVNERESQTLRLSSKVSDLASLARRIVNDEGITESELRSGSRRKKISKARRLFCPVAVERMGYPGAYVARFLGVTTSAVVRAANSENLGEIGKYQ